MRSFLKFSLEACRHGFRSVFTLVLWTLWLGLGLLLALQIYVAVVREFEIPPHVLRTLEQSFASAGLNASFGRTRFDPSGRILIEDLRVRLPGFAEPIATVRALSARVNPWSLLIGQIDELELGVTGLTFYSPAMISTTGRVEQLVRDLDATFIPDGRELLIPHLTCRLGSLPIALHGAVQLPPRRTAPGPSPNVAELLGKNYARISRDIAAAAEQLNRFEESRLRIELTPSEAHVAVAEFLFTARAAKWSSPTLGTGALTATAQIPLVTKTPEPLDLAITLERLDLPAQISAHNVDAQIHGRLGLAPFSFEPRDAEIVVREFRVGSAVLNDSVVRVTPRPLPSLHAELATVFSGLPLSLSADANLDARTAEASFFGRVDDGLLGVISSRIGRDVRQWIDFPQPVTITDARAKFSAGWKWENLHARLVVPIINAYHVPLTDGRVALELTPTRLYAPEAFAYIGENYARGSYDHDPATHRYRFLLEGQLRPLDISGWFGEWWPNFFQNLVFRTTIPHASVEVAGRWGRNSSGESRVIVSAEARAPEIFGAKFDHGRAHLVIRPHFLDALSFRATLGPGEAHGSFSRRLNPLTLEPQTVEFDVVSTLDPVGPAKMFGAAGTELIEPFAFDHVPALTIHGQIDADTAPGGAHQRVDVIARSNGPFRFHDFPFQHASLTVALRDDELTLESVEAGVADGSVRGRTKVWGRDKNRRLGFDYQLKDASLSKLVATLENYAARSKNAPTPSPNRFLADKASLHLDLAASAEGAYDNLLSYTGEGSATLGGAELGEIKLLGQLSDLFSFTALRFTAARANFRIDGPRLVFSDVSLTGANSAINAHGTYALDRRELDFNAKIFPFQESNLGFKSIFGAVLTPLSNVFEVKLTGSLEQPDWRFLIGPTNFLRTLSQGGSAAEAPVPSATVTPSSADQAPSTSR